jgi:hypothetical protein
MRPDPHAYSESFGLDQGEVAQLPGALCDLTRHSARRREELDAIGLKGHINKVNNNNSRPYRARRNCRAISSTRLNGGLGNRLFDFHLHR